MTTQLPVEQNQALYVGMGILMLFSAFSIVFIGRIVWYLLFSV